VLRREVVGEVLEEEVERRLERRRVDRGGDVVAVTGGDDRCRCDRLFALRS